MKNYLIETDIINYSHPSIVACAKELASKCSTQIELAKASFEYVLTQIDHTGDIESERITCKASEVLELKTGWCYAKSHLLAALLRANKIPTGFCYQRLRCDEYDTGSFCLHGLNAIYLDDYGWYRVDARGNKEGVNAQFTPPIEALAFELMEGEKDIDGIFENPLEVVVKSLSQGYKQMCLNFPDTV